MDTLFGLWLRQDATGYDLEFKKMWHLVFHFPLVFTDALQCGRS
jgi:hypothetical protein